MATTPKPSTETPEVVGEDTKPLTPEAFDLVRVCDAALDGAERTVRRFVVDADTKRYQLVNKPAVTREGIPLPLKPRIGLTTTNTNA